MVPGLWLNEGGQSAAGAALDQLIRHPNVFADTSGVRRFDYLVEAVRRAGPRKILFGSDGPWLHPGLELHKIRLLGLPPADEALLLGGNAQRIIFGIAPPPLAPASHLRSAPRPRAMRRPT